MTMKTKYIYIVLAACILAAACTKEGNTVANESQKLYLESWMEANHAGVNPSGLGIYILEDDNAGTGAGWSADYPYVTVDYTVTSLDGNISATNSEKLSRQLGIYNKAASYAPVVWTLGKGYSYAGVDEILSGMKVGQTRKAVIPNWLLTQKRYSNAEGYQKVDVDASPLIYTISLRSMTKDLRKSCTDQLHAYVRSNIDASADSLFYNNKDGDRLGFYYFTTKQPRPDSTFKEGNKIYVYYVGRRLDGQVFDTNIADTAKVHGIWSSSASYNPMEVTYSTTYTDIKKGSTTLISGFQAALLRMTAYEEATTLFYYSLGYGGTAQTLIPSYSSLCFDLKLVDKPE